MSDLGNKKIMANNIKKYMALKGINQTELCNALGFKFMTVSDWVNAKSYPRIDKIEMMANYFGITKSDLVEDKAKSEENMLLDCYLSDEHLRHLILFAGANIPKSERERYVAAVIQTIETLNKFR
jgi:transcriptional regulator with XRE-family HTH domain